MSTYNHLKKFLFRFSENVGVVYTLDAQVPHKIDRVDSKGIYIKAGEASLESQGEGEAASATLVRREWIEFAFDTFIHKGECKPEDLEVNSRRHSFLLALLAALPFAVADHATVHPVVRLKRFTTIDLSDEFNEAMRHISSVESSKQKLLQSPFFKLAYDMLHFMGETLTPRDKRETLLEAIFLTVVSSTSAKQIKESVARRKLSNTIKWLAETGLIDENLTPLPIGKQDQITSNEPKQFWWVNQGQGYQAQKEGGYLWAPKQGRSGTSFSHHTDLLKARPNDVVFAYANGYIRAVCLVKRSAHESERPEALSDESWQADGYLLPVDYFVIDPIPRDDVPLDWRLEENGPFDRNGNVKQGYFFTISEKFASQLYKKFASLFPQPVKQHFPFDSDDNIPKPVLFPSDIDAIDHIHTYIESKGFYYTRDDIKNVYLSLKTKPFVILSGTSGTGKTRIARLFAESLGATDDNGRFTHIAVRPDWSDGSELLGYVDIKGDFQEKPLTKALRSARENPDKPYFILLDEMNLARVEYYFSDLLSVMESRKWKGGKIVTIPVLPKDEVGETLHISDNVYFIGTVNMDETTHPFSKKVLDRANTIEFNHVQLDHFSFLEREDVEVQPVEAANEQLRAKYLHLKDAYTDHQSLIRRVTDELMKVNAILQKTGAHVGYRVRDEVCFYMIYSQMGELMPFEQAFDYQLLQKILPRLSGSDQRIQDILEALYEFCTGLIYEGGSAVLDTDESHIRFPKSARKIDHMLRGLASDGFTSFWL